MKSTKVNGDLSRFNIQDGKFGPGELIINKMEGKSEFTLGIQNPNIAPIWEKVKVPHLPDSEFLEIIGQYTILGVDPNGPCNISVCEKHASANKLGILQPLGDEEKTKLCPCCAKNINKVALKPFKEKLDLSLSSKLYFNSLVFYLMILFFKFLFFDLYIMLSCSAGNWCDDNECIGHLAWPTVAHINVNHE